MFDHMGMPSNIRNSIINILIDTLGYDPHETDYAPDRTRHILRGLGNTVVRYQDILN